MKEEKMQTNQKEEKPSELATHAFDLSKSFSNMSRIGQLYGKLSMLLDMKIWLLTEEEKLRKQIKENEESLE